MVDFYGINVGKYTRPVDPLAFGDVEGGNIFFSSCSISFQGVQFW